MLAAVPPLHPSILAASVLIAAPTSVNKYMKFELYLSCKKTLRSVVIEESRVTWHCAEQKIAKFNPVIAFINNSNKPRHNSTTQLAKHKSCNYIISVNVVSSLIPFLHLKIKLFWSLEHYGSALHKKNA